MAEPHEFYLGLGTLGSDKIHVFPRPLPKDHVWATSLCGFSTMPFLYSEVIEPNDVANPDLCRRCLPAFTRNVTGADDWLGRGQASSL